MATNLLIYKKAKELVSALELADEQGRELRNKDIFNAVVLLNQVFQIIERRGK